ncbi:pilus assembly protein TadG-related protein [Roseibium sp.]|uniref:pilus assembly protein TadG-related protein n=1 Tax=Roseibium sp. TaxID=1936156 RepID=UPI003D0FDB6F
MTVIRLLVQDRQGSILPIFGLLVIFLVVIGGAAIDVSRAVNAREKLAYAIDASALSLAVELAGREMNDADVKLHLENSFEANLKDSEWKTRAIENIAWTINQAEGWVEVRSSSRLEDYFLGRLMGYGMDAIGPEKLNFGTTGRAAYGEQDMEIALALDISGSMDRQDMAELKKAATRLVSELIPEGTPDHSTKVRIGIAPWTDSINAEKIPAILDSNDADYSYWPSRCISGRHTDHQFEPYLRYGDGRSYYMRGAEAVHWVDYDPNDWRENDPTNLGCPWSSPVTPITSDRDDLLKLIKGLRSGGGTSVHLGIDMAWRLLSPEWAEAFPARSRPRQYGGSVKIALLMTDGDSNTAYSMRSRNSKCTWPNYEPCRLDTREPEWYWTYHGSFSYDSPTYARARRYCDILRQKDVIVWTVFFDNRVWSDAPEKLMAYCAANGGEYIKVDDAARMTQAFTGIAKKIQNVYLAR